MVTSHVAYFTGTYTAHQSNVRYCRPAGETPGPAQNTCVSYSLPIPPSDQTRWGDVYVPPGDPPSEANNVSLKSGLGWEGVVSQIVLVNTDFFIGTLTHFNFPIYNATNGTDLTIVFQLWDQYNNTLGNYSFPFHFIVDETPNTGPVSSCTYPSITPCADAITFSQGGFVYNVSFLVNQVSYTLQLEGFRESQDSTSAIQATYVSQENQANQAYLFARITQACPPVCSNTSGASYIITSNNTCICNCSSATTQCPTGQVRQADCSCACPDLQKCSRAGTNGTLLPNQNCSCQCNACPYPRVLNSTDCSCNCPTDGCNGGIMNPNTCACDCSALGQCSVANDIRDSRCNCYCPLTCQLPKVLYPSNLVCACVCPNTTCPSGFTFNNTNCTCDCNPNCPNGQIVNYNNCSCGACVGNWTKDANGLCTICGLNVSQCAPNEVVDQTTCACFCGSLNCDLNLGLVVDTQHYCTCKNCSAGQCICGNNRVEAGEQCDFGPGNPNPCCINCQWTISPCDDGNPCSTGDTCNGNGTCIGTYKCPPSTECDTITCDSSNPNAQCVHTFQPDGSNCQGTNLCSTRCLNGTCDSTPVSCPTESDPLNCKTWICEPNNGSCVEINKDDGTSCSDDNQCTKNDQCMSGTCVGTPIVCQSTDDPCNTVQCSLGLCVTIPVNGGSCNADNNSCTVGDSCRAGSCQAGQITICTSSDQCKVSVCDPESGSCLSQNKADNTTCDDLNICTHQDACTNGACQGILDPTYQNTLQCGGSLSQGNNNNSNNSLLYFTIAGAAALIAAVVGVAFLVKKIRDSRLTDPDTWNPSAFNSVAANPLYQGSESAVDNPFYEGK